MSTKNKLFRMCTILVILAFTLNNIAYAAHIEKSALRALSTGQKDSIFLNEIETLFKLLPNIDNHEERGKTEGLLRRARQSLISAHPEQAKYVTGQRSSSGGVAEVTLDNVFAPNAELEVKIGSVFVNIKIAGYEEVLWHFAAMSHGENALEFYNTLERFKRDADNSLYIGFRRAMLNFNGKKISAIKLNENGDVYLLIKKIEVSEDPDKPLQPVAVLAIEPKGNNVVQTPVAMLSNRQIDFILESVKVDEATKDMLKALKKPSAKSIFTKSSSAGLERYIKLKPIDLEDRQASILHSKALSEELKNLRYSIIEGYIPETDTETGLPDARQVEEARNQIFEDEELIYEIDQLKPKRIYIAAGEFQYEGKFIYLLLVKDYVEGNTVNRLIALGSEFGLELIPDDKHEEPRYKITGLQYYDIAVTDKEGLKQAIESFKGILEKCSGDATAAVELKSLRRHEVILSNAIKNQSIAKSSSSGSDKQDKHEKAKISEAAQKLIERAETAAIFMFQLDRNLGYAVDGMDREDIRRGGDNTVSAGKKEFESFLESMDDVEVLKKAFRVLKKKYREAVDAARKYPGYESQTLYLSEFITMINSKIGKLSKIPAGLSLEEWQAEQVLGWMRKNIAFLIEIDIARIGGMARLAAMGSKSFAESQLRNYKIEAKRSEDFAGSPRRISAEIAEAMVGVINANPGLWRAGNLPILKMIVKIAEDDIKTAGQILREADAGKMALANNKLYIADSGSIRVFSEDGSAEKVSINISQPHAISSGGDDILYLADSKTGAIKIFSIASKGLKREIKLKGKAKESLLKSLLVADEKIFALDAETDELMVFKSKNGRQFSPRRLKKVLGYLKFTDIYMSGDFLVGLNMRVLTPKERKIYNIGEHKFVAPETKSSSSGKVMKLSPAQLLKKLQAVKLPKGFAQAKYLAIRIQALAQKTERASDNAEDRLINASILLIARMNDQAGKAWKNESKRYVVQSHLNDIASYIQLHKHSSSTKAKFSSAGSVIDLLKPVRSLNRQSFVDKAVSSAA